MQTINQAAQSPENGLKPYISPLGAWALAQGTSIGWGSMVVTCNTYLLQAGPMGSVLGLIIGALIMIVISRNYHYLMCCYPSAGGAYYHVQRVFGYDHAFLTAWFLMLTYLAVLWANATSLPLFSKYFLGRIFCFGRMYTILGYDVYFGEVMLTMLAIVLTAFLCKSSNKITIWLMTGLVIVFCIGIMVCFFGAIFNMGGNYLPMEPSYVPDKNELSQILRIACISPWAFIGFENISHASEEFRFSHTKNFRILTMAVITTTVLYAAITLLSVTAYPPEYENWLAYIKDLDNLEGIKGLPPFYAASRHMGQLGVNVLVISLFALIVTSLIGNTVALSRLLYSAGKEGMVPTGLGKLNRKGIPENAILLVMTLSLIIPFLGRTAIGWIVDVTTLGATLIYGFVSAAALKVARVRNDKVEQATGAAGLGVMILFAVFLLLPNLLSQGTMAQESYILFTVWAVLGFVTFRTVLHWDKGKKYGKSIIVWVVLLLLILFTSLVWMSEADKNSANQAMMEVRAYYKGQDASFTASEEVFMEGMARQMYQATMRSMMVVVTLFTISMIMMLSNFKYMSRRAAASEAELFTVKSMANKDPLTGVQSKHAYVERVKRVDDRIKDGSVENFAVAVCDVNGLKHVNDTMGHQAGDEYICAAAKLICGHFAHSPVFRIGGDEFVVLMAGGDFENRHEIIDGFNQVCEANIGQGRVVVSLGLADYVKGKDQTFHQVFERADALMYVRKKELKGMGAITRE